MQQHITEKQFNELSKKQKKNLNKWWIPKEGDIYLGVYMAETIKTDLRQNSVVCEACEEEYGIPDSDYINPLLSIGQMIEFLNEHDRWDYGTAQVTADGLCDSLWEACKEILNN